MGKLQEVSLQRGKDIPIWVLENSGQYTSRSMYRFLSYRGVVNKRMEKLWHTKLPLKLKIFMWLAIQGRIQTGAALKQKKWKGDENCSLCNSLESVDHVLFQCVMACFVWAIFKEALGWDRAPNSLTDLFDHWITLGCKDYELHLFHFVIVAWGIWVTRNKIRIQNWFPRSPITVLYKVQFFLQKWSMLLRESEREELAPLYSTMKRWRKDYEESRTPYTKDWWL